METQIGEPHSVEHETGIGEAHSVEHVTEVGEAKSTERVELPNTGFSSVLLLVAIFVILVGIVMVRDK